MKSIFTMSAIEAIEAAKKFVKKTKDPYVGTEQMLYGLMMCRDSVAADVLSRNQFNTTNIVETAAKMRGIESTESFKIRNQFTPKMKKILEDSHKEAKRYNASETGTEHILIAILKDNNNAAVKLIVGMKINPNKIYADLLLAMGLDPAEYKEDILNRQVKKKKKAGEILEKYSKDLTKSASEGEMDPIIGRNDEMQRIIQTLCRRTKNNPCLVGEAGVGKTAIVEGIAQKIATKQVPNILLDKRVLSLNLSSMVAGTKYRGEFEERMKKLIDEVVREGNVILFLDEIHTLIGAGGSEGSINAANILKPALARGEIQLIGATTNDEYKKYFEKDSALERRFLPINVEEPTVEETIDILQGIRDKYEEHHNVEITDIALETAAILSNRYINDRNLPDKAIDLMDEVGAAARLSNNTNEVKLNRLVEQCNDLKVEVDHLLELGDIDEARSLRVIIAKLDNKINKLYDNGEKKIVIDEDDVANIVSLWTNVPVQKLAEKESEKLVKLENVLSKRVIGQKEAIEAVSKAIRRSRVGIQDPNRPIGSFLFLGPTGIGKTELSKVLAEVMFGNQKSLIRVDMSEYMESHSVSKMIGSPPGYVGFEDGGQLSEKIRKNPYAVILFDEIEKAHPDVFNILLQVLDDGHITDSKGKKVNFKNTIIIMTSNAGAMKIVEPKNLGFATETTKEQDHKKMKDNVMDEVKKIFKPEFINRVDEMIVFHALGKEEMKEIVNLITKKLCDRCKKQMNIDLILSAQLREHIVNEYTNLKMGARPIKRAVQSVIEDALAQEILLGNVKENDKVTMGYRNKKVTIKSS